MGPKERKKVGEGFLVEVPFELSPKSEEQVEQALGLGVGAWQTFGDGDQAGVQQNGDLGQKAAILPSKDGPEAWQCYEADVSPSYKEGKQGPERLPDLSSTTQLV